jgi:hypothetical protein
MYIYILYIAVSNEKRKTEAPGVFLNPFTVCSSSKRKFFVYPFVDEENKRKLSICKQTKRACPSMVSSDMVPRQDLAIDTVHGCLNSGGGYHD